MKLLSVNVGLPREIEVDGKTVVTSIYKAPVAGRVHVRQTNIEGDQQSDLTRHGGIRKAVYAYPSEHYAYWREVYPNLDLQWGALGENLTTEGLLETTTRIGDTLRIGSAEFVVTQPRNPCFKLAIRFDSDEIIKRFHDSRLSGFYLSVSREGEIGKNDAIERIGRLADSPTVAAVLA